MHGNHRLALRELPINQINLTLFSLEYANWTWLLPTTAKQGGSELSITSNHCSRAETLLSIAKTSNTSPSEVAGTQIRPAYIRICLNSTYNTICPYLLVLQFQMYLSLHIYSMQCLDVLNNFKMYLLLYT